MLAAKESENTALKAKLEKERRGCQEVIKHQKIKSKVIVSDLVKTLKAAETTNDLLKDASS